MNRDALERWLSSALPHWPALEIESLAEVDGGWESDVYDVRLRHGPPHCSENERLALRRYVGDENVAQREFDGMRHLFAAGYPVPQVLAVEPSDEVLGRPFMVMRWVEGEVRSWRKADLDALARLMTDLHRLDWRPLHTGPTPTPGGASALVEEWRPQLTAFPSNSFLECLEWAARAAPSIGPQPAIVHLDFHTGNVLIDGNGAPSVIDWTQVGVSDRRLDIAWTELLITMALDEAAAAHFRAAYELATGPLEDMEWFEVAASVKRLFSVLVSLEAGPEVLGMRPEARQQIEDQVHTLAVPHERLLQITGIDVTEARSFFDR